MPDEAASRPALERDLSRYWHDERLPADLRLIDGRRVQVVYRGVWSNSDGPDFANAMVEIAGRLTRGAVELHMRSSDWMRHGHDTDPAYDEVILHVVASDDLPEPARTSSGRAVPTLELGPYVLIERIAGSEGGPAGMDRLGKEVCLPTLAGRRSDLVRAAIRRKGWERLVDKQLRLSQAMAVTTPGEALYHALLDALGFSRNREGMALLAECLPLALLESILADYGPNGVGGALLGVAGLLPLSPAHCELAGVSERLAAEQERMFRKLERHFGFATLSPGVWSLNRVRPANHPIRRLASLASLVSAAGSDGLLGRLLALPLDTGKSWDAWLASASPALGEGRRRQIITNVFAPFFGAYAEVMRDDDLAEDVAALWERLPGNVDDRIARAARRQIVGESRFPIRTALEEQGLHQIARFGCAELRCFECPIAALAVQHESWLGPTGRDD